MMLKFLSISHMALNPLAVAIVSIFDIFPNINFLDLGEINDRDIGPFLSDQLFLFKECYYVLLSWPMYIHFNIKCVSNVKEKQT